MGGNSWAEPHLQPPRVIVKSPCARCNREVISWWAQSAWKVKPHKDPEVWCEDCLDVMKREHKLQYDQEIDGFVYDGPCSTCGGKAHVRVSKDHATEFNPAHAECPACENRAMLIDPSLITGDPAMPVTPPARPQLTLVVPTKAECAPYREMPMEITAMKEDRDRWMTVAHMEQEMLHHKERQFEIAAVEMGRLQRRLKKERARKWFYLGAAVAATGSWILYAFLI